MILIYTYATLLSVSIVYDIFALRLPQLNFELTYINIYKLLLIILVAVLFFMADFFIYNMLTNKIILIDIRYYFSGKLNFYKYSVSLVFTIMEELLFRFFLLEELGTGFLIILLSGISFGVTHIFFSRYDVFSKTFLGLLCAIAYAFTGSIVFSIVLHGTYNIMALKEKYVMEGHDESDTNKQSEQELRKEESAG
ncbi:MAG: CPBP family intramembrane glutamic endopeptidase [Bacillota bacterium]